MSDVKLCKDCAHFFARLDESCRRPIGTTFSPVYGEQIVNLDRAAHAERLTDEARMFFHARGIPRCGPNGRYFEPKRSPTQPPPSGDDL